MAASLACIACLQACSCLAEPGSPGVHVGAGRHHGFRRGAMLLTERGESLDQKLFRWMMERYREFIVLQERVISGRFRFEVDTGGEAGLVR